MSENKLIKLENIEKTYKTGDQPTVALSGIDLKIEQGEFLAIIGPSGSGKSTLMHILGLLDTPSSGRYFLEGNDVSRLTKNRLAKIRNQKIGFVFQQFNLLPRTSVLDNVLLPTVYGKIQNAGKTARDLLKNVGLSKKIKSRSNQLSGGEIQRVAIARALMMQPAIILADEPTGNLDSKTSTEIMKIFQKINKGGATIVLITHEKEIAAFAKRVIELRDGKIIKDSEAK